ncbi:MAG: hypothetical protein AAB974_02585 [Patescibacteria group bacterium]
MRTFISRLALAALAVSAMAPLSVAAITDSTPPVVSSVTPTTTYKNQATTYDVTTSDDIAGVDGCDLYVNTVNQGAMTMTLISGMNWRATRSYTYTGSAGTISIYARCRDGAMVPNFANGATTSITIFVDNSPPAVSNLLPATATVGVATTISAFAMDDEFGSGINTCGGIIDGVESGLMTPSGSTYSLSGVTFSTAGSHTLQVNCFDRTGNLGTASRTVTVSAPADTTAPVVNQIDQSTATAGTALTLTAIAMDNVGISSCSLYVGGVSQGTMAVLGGVASRSHTFPAAGSYAADVRCTDAAGNPTTGASRTIVVAAAADSTLPTVTGVGPTTASTGSAVTLTATVADNIGVSSCTLYVGGTSQGAMTVSSGVASRSHTFASAGSSSVEIRCVDAAGNTGTGSATVTVSASPATADTTLPIVGQVAQTTATAGTAITLTVAASDNIGISSCTLYVGGVSQGTMAVSGGSASRSHTFSSSGNIAVEVRCTDATGNIGIGVSRTIVVAAAVTPVPPTPVPISTGADLDTDGDDLSDADEAVYGTSPTNRDTDGDGFADGTEVRNGYNPLGAGRISPPTTSAVPGRLIKLACPAGANGYHPCKAVYYYGRDGKRHTFPSARIYATWFNDFSTVQVVDAAFMASLSVGKNVLPRPGVRLVKFETVNTVYAVDRGGILRGISNETVAAGIYGSTWNTKLDDVVDTLFGNFLIGTDITSALDYSPATVTAGTTSIDGNF